jgi:putative ATPase
MPKKSSDQGELFAADTSHQPLAHKMRPASLDDYIGQEHILAKGKMLRRAIEADMIPSVILYGTPGSGKTSLARIIATTTKSRFIEINATDASVSDIRKNAEDAKEALKMGAKTTLFIDEIHRFNKGQQDALLPHVENGTLRLIGATTQNPYFAINGPLVSRSQIYQLQPLEPHHIKTLLERALERHLTKVTAESTALDLLVARSDGDARRALNALELAAKTTEPLPGTGGKVHITDADAAESIQSKTILYDQNGDAHYDTTSAFCKSLRGSDPNAALYWMAKMLEAGEEPRYIARRLVIHAAEDVGMADPSAILTATAAQSAVETIGLPEAKIPLAMAVIHICLAPKSNSACAGIAAATRAVKEYPLLEVPPAMRDTHYASAGELGNGVGYKFPHDFYQGFVKQNYLPADAPDELKNLYRPSGIGKELILWERLKALRGDPE